MPEDLGKVPAKECDLKGIEDLIAKMHSLALIIRESSRSLHRSEKPTQIDPARPEESKPPDAAGRLFKDLRSLYRVLEDALESLTAFTG